VRAAKTAYPGKKIAVYLAAFEEGAQILDRARLDSDLTRNWYGGDGLTQSQALLASPAVAAFAAAAKFTAPAVALPAQTADRWMLLSAEIEARTGFTPDAFSLSVYDAVWAGVLASVEARNHDAFRRAAFVRTVQRYWASPARWRSTTPATASSPTSISGPWPTPARASTGCAPRRTRADASCAEAQPASAGRSIEVMRP
jgi:hypothetical protein